MKVTVLGAGAWGTALGRCLTLGKHEVTLWAHRPEHLDELRRTGQNERYLPGIDLPRNWRFCPDLGEAVVGAECVVVAVPSKAVREVAGQLSGYQGLLVSVTKGIEWESGLTMCGILESSLSGRPVAALSGPTLAMEVVRDNPAAMVAASPHTEAAVIVQKIFHRPAFRVYTSTDRLGVELGGALKNIIAIAAGVSDGLGFGDNSKAALVTRAIVEIRRLGVACGAQPETFAGLSGLGDLTVTCFSKLSRNRMLGERLGRGESLEEILQKSVSVAEGYPTARSAFQLARKLQVITPIIDQVFLMLYENKNVLAALQALTSRDSKPEDAL